MSHDPIEQVIEKMRRASRVLATRGFRPDANWFRGRLEELANELQHEYIALLGSARLQKELKGEDTLTHVDSSNDSGSRATGGKE